MKILITGGLGHIGSYLLENINKIKFVKKIKLEANMLIKNVLSFLFLYLEKLF